jgi:hypothetical protein
MTTFSSKLTMLKLSEWAGSILAMFVTAGLLDETYFNISYKTYLGEHLSAQDCEVFFGLSHHY